MSGIMTVWEGTLNTAHEQRTVTGRGQHHLMAGGDVPLAETEVEDLERPEQNHSCDISSAWYQR